MTNQPRARSIPSRAYPHVRSGPGTHTIVSISPVRLALVRTFAYRQYAPRGARFMVDAERRAWVEFPR